MDIYKTQVLKLLSIALQLATSSGIFDNELSGVIKNADSINDFCDAVAELEKKENV